MQCRGKNSAGKPCGAPVIRGKKHCVMHSGRAAELGSKGGRRRAVYNPDNLKEIPPPKTLTDLQELLAQSLVEVRSGKMDPRLANSISYLAASLMRTLDNADPAFRQPAGSGTVFEIYKSKWLREREAALAQQLEQQYAGVLTPERLRGFIARFLQQAIGLTESKQEKTDENV